MFRAGNRWLPVILTGTLAVTVLAGCGGNATTRATKSTSASPSAVLTPSGVSTAKTITHPVKFDMANSVTFPETEVQEPVITGDVIVTRSPTAITARKLPSLNSAYSMRAANGSFADLWVAQGGKLGVTVELSRQSGTGTAVGRDTYALTQFDLASGKVRRSTSVSLDQDSLSGASPTTARVIGMAGSVVVLDSWPASNPSDAFAANGTRHTTVAIDLGAKKLIWSHRAARPLAMASDRVVVNTGWLSRRGVIQALSIDTGAVQWQALSEVRVASAAVASKQRVLVVTSRPNSHGGLVTSISLTDGTSTSGVRTTSWNWSCYPTATPVAVCAVGGSQVVGWNIDTNTAAWSLPNSGRVMPAVTAVVDGIVYGAANGAGVALDAQTGHDVGSATGSVPQSVSEWGAVSLLDGQAVFQRSIDAAKESSAP